MGNKSKYLILILLLHFSGADAQEDFMHVDSLTYKYYLSGDWEKLTASGEQAVTSGIDYKFLRQRLGIAYFSLGNYYRAREHFKKALEHDSYDQFTIMYLYLSYLYAGKAEFAGTMVSGMEPQIRGELNVEKITPVKSIDSEYGYTFTASGFRTDAQYYRLGLESRIGYRFGLYQSISGYTQSVAEDFTPDAGTFLIRQPEYFAMVRLNIAPRLILNTAYHYLKTRRGDLSDPGHLFNAGLSFDLNRLILGTHVSFTRYLGESTFQPSIETGYVFPGKSSFYLKGNLALLLNSGGSNLIFAPRAGLQIWKGAWLEGHAAFGEMTLYNDFHGLYVYNSYDPLVMKGGATFTYFAGRRFSFWLNFTYGKKEYINYSTAGYKQFTYLGGIKWTF